MSIRRTLSDGTPVDFPDGWDNARIGSRLQEIEAQRSGPPPEVASAFGKLGVGPEGSKRTGPSFDVPAILGAIALSSLAPEALPSEALMGVGTEMGLSTVGGLSALGGGLGHVGGSLAAGHGFPPLADIRQAMTEQGAQGLGGEAFNRGVMMPAARGLARSAFPPAPIRQPSTAAFAEMKAAENAQVPITALETRQLAGRAGAKPATAKIAEAVAQRDLLTDQAARRGSRVTKQQIIHQINRSSWPKADKAAARQVLDDLEARDPGPWTPTEISHLDTRTAAKARYDKGLLGATDPVVASRVADQALRSAQEMSLPAGPIREGVVRYNQQLSKLIPLGRSVSRSIGRKRPGLSLLGVPGMIGLGTEGAAIGMHAPWPVGVGASALAAALARAAMNPGAESRLALMAAHPLTQWLARQAPHALGSQNR